MWLKTDTGNYVQMTAYRSLYAAGSGSDWHLWMDLEEGGGSVQLNGTFSSEAEAQEAARRITQGQDPASFI